MNTRSLSVLSSSLVVVVVVLATTRISTTAAFAVRSWVSSPSSKSSSSCTTRPTTTRQQSLGLLAKKKTNNDNDDNDNDDDDDEEVALGMEQAFEKLENLQSLEKDDSVKPIPKRQFKQDIPSSSSSSSSLPLEQEIEVYKNLIGESESKDDVYSKVLADMVTQDKDQPENNKEESATPLLFENSSSSSSSSSFLLDDPAMQQALASAMQQVSAKNPNLAQSALNDKEIMKEINVIMERGNAELLAELDIIRKEQRAYAASKAADKAQQAADDYEASQQARLAAAEQAVQTWLQRVRNEQAAVQQAIDDLTRLTTQTTTTPGNDTTTTSSIASKLRQGGLPKQMALVGLLLFSVRSILDTVASFSDPTLLSSALIQGAIALACAAYFFLV